MPTAAEFDNAARQFDGAAEETSALLQPIASTALDDVLRGGRLRTTVEAALAVTSANVLAATEQLRAAADEARSRADECRAYAALLAEYRNDVEQYEQHIAAGVVERPFPTAQGPYLERPPRPSKPHRWIEL